MESAPRPVPDLLQESLGGPAHRHRKKTVDQTPRAAVTVVLRERTQAAVAPLEPEPMVTVTILAGPHTGEWFATGPCGLRDGLRFAYLDGPYLFTCDRVTGRWGAIPAPSPRHGRTRHP